MRQCRSMSQIRVDEREQAEMSRWHADSEMINTSRCVFIAACFRQHSLTCDGHNVILNSRTTHTHILANSIQKKLKRNFTFLLFCSFEKANSFCAPMHSHTGTPSRIHSSEQIFILNCCTDIIGSVNWRWRSHETETARAKERDAKRNIAREKKLTIYLFILWV